MKPRYSTLLRHLKKMAGDVASELDANGKEDVMDHPMLRAKYFNLKKALKVIAKAEGIHP